MQKAFTLIELLVVIALLGILAAVVLLSINPIEQFNRTKDASNKVNATNFLNAINRYQVAMMKNPTIINYSDTTTCSEIITAGPVFDFTSLSDELVGWFSQRITEPGSELYLGMDDGGNAKVCYKVQSIINVSKVPRFGCTVQLDPYLCFPE